MPYLYVSNVSPRDGFNQIDLQMDNGRKLTLNRGSTYNLTSNELTRARRFIVLAPSSNTPTSSGVQYLPVKGVLSQGDVPVWDESEGAFLPGTGGGGGGGNSQTWLWDDATSQYVLTALPVRTFVGPTDPVSTGITMRDGDVWNPAGA